MPERKFRGYKDKRQSQKQILRELDRTDKQHLPPKLLSFVLLRRKSLPPPVEHSEC